ncbi:hypothetical protein [Streptococcus oricebi]|uniref:Uncharacterized protein n=1 Tax=Streptococcus oricebi TaxID=1547447 RepID=A0ABS5B3C2_9STRE|nr:hypothetical protein [Streptococcus oricebi]MBP2623317.1 hypothetical protein [Streptococcus oricebi]
MVSNKRKIGVTVSLAFIIIIASIFWYFSSRIYWKYDDQWILGKTKEQVETRYGKFDYQIHAKSVAYLIDDGNKTLFTVDEKVAEYYFMIFNDQGKCIKIHVGGKPGG